MTELLVLAFDTQDDAFALRKRMETLTREGFLDTRDMVVVTRDGAGKVRLHQQVNLPVTGAAGGTLWGAVIGAVFLSPVAGAAIGAGVGALAGLASDIGINDAFMRAVSDALPPEGAALFVLLRRVGAAETLKRMRNLGATGRELSTPLELAAAPVSLLRESLARGGTIALSGAQIGQGMIGRLGRIGGASAY